MNTTLTASAVICAALVSGCSTVPTLPVPSGDWEDFHQTPLTSPTAPASVSAPKPVAVATTTTSALPAINAAVPVAQSKLPPAPVAPVPPSVLEPKPADPKPSISAPVTADLAKNPANAPSKPVVSISPAPVLTPQKVIVSAPVPPMVIATVTSPPKPLPEPWVVSANDATLRRALTKWVQRAGWQLVWDASVDVPINVDAKFTGDFNTAVKSLFQSLSAADVNLSAVLYSGNRVLRVTESGRRAQ